MAGITTEIGINKVWGDMKVTIHVTGLKFFKVRLKVAILLIKLACKVGGLRLDGIGIGEGNQNAKPCCDSSDLEKCAQCQETGPASPNNQW